MRKKLIIAFMIIFPLLPFFSFYGFRLFSEDYFPRNKHPEIAEKLKKHVYMLSHTIGERHIYKMDRLDESLKYISQEFKSYGYNIEFQKFQQAQKEAYHIIARWPDANEKDIIIIGAIMTPSEEQAVPMIIQVPLPECLSLPA